MSAKLKKTISKLKLATIKKPAILIYCWFLYFFVYVVPGEGLEPSRHCWHRILSPARLPIPPSRLRMRSVL